MTLDARGALEFVERHGVVLESARGPVPRMTEAIIDEPIAGSWWGHPRGHEIYAVLSELTESEHIVSCRAVGGKVTFVHRRLWPALHRAAEHVGTDRCARVEHVHTDKGHHVAHETPIAQWAPPFVVTASAAMTLADAIAALGPWAASPAPGGSRRTGPSR